MMDSLQLQGFSRREVMALTGLEEYRLTYLQRTGIVVPETFKPEGYVKSFPRYSWHQLLEIRAIEDLRSQDVSLQKVRLLMDFLKEHSNDPKLHTNDLVVINDRVFWIAEQGDLEKCLIECLGKNKGQVTIAEVILINNPSEKIWQTAQQNSKIIDFATFKSKVAEEQGTMAKSA